MSVRTRTQGMHCALQGCLLHSFVLRAGPRRIGQLLYDGNFEAQWGFRIRLACWLQPEEVTCKGLQLQPQLNVTKLPVGEWNSICICSMIAGGAHIKNARTASSTRFSQKMFVPSCRARPRVM